MEYVCQQCRAWGYRPDCQYEFHPHPPEGVPDRWREAAEKREADGSGGDDHARI